MTVIKSMELQRCRGWARPFVVIATGFGLGLSPLASGTAGAVLGVLIMGIMAPVWADMPRLVQSAFVLFLSLLAIPLCHVAEAHFGVKDDRRIVADEFLTFPICLVGLPVTCVTIVVGFITSRLFDVIKPPPARQLQAWPGGVGIVVDDVVSGLYSLMVNHLLMWGISGIWGSTSV